MRNKGCMNCTKSYGLFASCGGCQYYLCKEFVREKYDPITGETRIVGGNCEELNKNGDCTGFVEIIPDPIVPKIKNNRLANFKKYFFDKKVE